jgi:DNA-binding protein HU-beta
VNKAELVRALAERLGGDRGTASAAVDGLLDVIVRAVGAGESVSVAGFGVFERRERAARSGRNPHTGQAIQVPAAVVPAFRPGAYFRDVVSGVREPITVRVAAGHHPVRSTATGRPPARSAPMGDPLARPAATRPPAPAAANPAPRDGAETDRAALVSGPEPTVAAGTAAPDGVADRPSTNRVKGKTVKRADNADAKVGKGKGSGKEPGKNDEPASGRGSAKVSGNGSTKDSGKGAGKASDPDSAKASGKDSAKASGKNGNSVGGKAKKKAKK